MLSVTVFPIADNACFVFTKIDLLRFLKLSQFLIFLIVESMVQNKFSFLENLENSKQLGLVFFLD